MDNASSLTENARALRRNMTRQEHHLWYDFLKGYNVKFYRQRVFDNYIVDFYCSKAHLAIEIDGSQHYNDKDAEYDKKRTEVLNKHNIEVIRFSNLEIDRCFKEVCCKIDLKIKENVR